MRAVFGILLIIAGVGFGIYVGVWVMFIGGIVQIIEAIKASPVEAFGIACGLLQVFLSGIVGVLTTYISIFPGFVLLSDN